MRYTGEYVSSGLDKIVGQFKKDYKAAELDVDIDGIMNDPNILDLMRFLGDTANLEYSDIIIRQCILGKKVTFFIDGDTLDSFILNDINASWAVIPVVNNYPAAYKALADIVQVHLLKKSMLPPKKETGKAAAEIAK